MPRRARRGPATVKNRSVSFEPLALGRTATARSEALGAKAHAPGNPFSSRGLPDRLSETGLSRTSDVPLPDETRPSNASSGDAASSRVRGDAADVNAASARTPTAARPPIRTLLTRRLH